MLAHIVGYLKLTHDFMKTEVADADTLTVLVYLSLTCRSESLLLELPCFSTEPPMIDSLHQHGLLPGHQRASFDWQIIDIDVENEFQDRSLWDAIFQAL